MMSFDSYHYATQQSGFTLIELMISGCIIGILGAIALPMYQDYTTEAKLSEVILAASACRLSVIDVVQFSSASKLSMGLSSTCDTITTKYVKNITVNTNGVISVHANETQLPSLTTNTNILTLAPIQTGNNQLVGINANETIASWRCGSPIDGTTIPNRYLPKSCKGNS